jgi:hypothetical protein
MPTKVCSRCKIRKNEDRCFYEKKRGTGKTSWCRACIDRYKNTKSGRRVVPRSAYVGSLVRKWKNYSYDAKKKGVKFELTFNEYKDIVETNTTCFYCGYTYDHIKSIFDKIASSKSSLRSIRKLKRSLRVAMRSQGLTLDEKDSFGDYSKENCVMACHLCNQAKGWAIPAEAYRSIASSPIANIVRICKEAGLEI